MNQKLLSMLQQLPVPMPSTEIARLEPRKLEESSFHDEWRAEDEGGDDDANLRWYEAAGPVKQYVWEWTKRYVPSGVFLDYACGYGPATLRAVDAGAAFALGIDISLVSVEGAARRAKEMGYDEKKVRFVQRDCEDTHLPDNAFTAALCSGMLHHLDMDRAFPELYRIMAPGGRLICNEPLAYNPAIQRYRKRTPELRTAWEAEHILTWADIERARGVGFRVENVRFWFLLSPLGALLPKGWLRRSMISVLHVLEWPLVRLPGLKWWSWQMTFELVKPA